jgi:hypothetical protein
MFIRMIAVRPHNFIGDNVKNYEIRKPQEVHGTGIGAVIWTQASPIKG